MKKLVEVDVRPPSWVWRLAVTLLLVLTMVAAQHGINLIVHQYTSAVAMDQLKGTPEAYNAARSAQLASTFAVWGTIATLVSVVLLWGTYIRKLCSYYEQTQAADATPSDGTTQS